MNGQQIYLTTSAKAGKKQQQLVKEEAGKPCHSYNTGACTHQKNHTLDGIRMLYICSYCFKHGNNRYLHQESSCHRRGGKA